MAKVTLPNWGRYAVRKAAGIKGKKPNTFNACIRSQLLGKSYPDAPKGAGGRLDSRIRNAFKAAVSSCKK